MSPLGEKLPLDVARFGEARAELLLKRGEPVLRIRWRTDGEALLGLVNLLAGRGARTEVDVGHVWTVVDLAYTERLGKRVRELAVFLAAVWEVDPRLKQLEMVGLLETVEEAVESVAV